MIKRTPYDEGERAAVADCWCGWVEWPNPNPDEVVAAQRAKLGVTYRDPLREEEFWQGYRDEISARTCRPQP